MRVAWNSISCPGPRRIAVGRALTFAVVALALFLTAATSRAGLMVSSPSVTVDETGQPDKIEFTVTNDGKGKSGLLADKTAFLPFIDTKWPDGYSFPDPRGHYVYKILPITGDNTDKVDIFGPTSDPIPASLAPNGSFKITFTFKPDNESDGTPGLNPGVTKIQLLVGWSEKNGGDVINQPGLGTITVQDVNALPEPSSLILLGTGIAAMGGYAWRRRKMAAA